MVYYVRFLKTPRIQKQQAGALSVNALVCITTDLGDAFLAQDVDLLAVLTVEDSDVPLYQESLAWKAGKRELSVSLGPFSKDLSRSPIVLGVRAIEKRGKPFLNPADNLQDASSIPLVISGWSAPFGGPQLSAAERVIERRLFLQDGRPAVRIWEETGNSIARHIWDAALASMLYLQSGISSSSRSLSMQSLQERISQNDNLLHVLELGAGCGIVGISLAHLRSQTSVVLTDLPEVEEIVMRNISVSSPAKASGVKFETLDWDEEPPKRIRDTEIDLILVSDCTYNADSLPSLVSVLKHLTALSPRALILVALKRRHDSEAIFFDLMQSADLQALQQDSVLLPAAHGQADRIELHAYGRQPR
ncbi:hypothetical protein ASPZODRAFT_153542 [Penicilliopsis zonata CBS 506.65]|uniref:Uncharacterized protein n=1 Tax=Penicilliopsis zonata CBS 506.65 TaxID=1073090 RepID=A0A1L9SBP3_9EURO|nr:hypothetical protein ASPZODRAFT_153542 [Penicilliopsis zonata CBS 506.65]OJJ44635.1 hypothetical protein ASPZODRAFT_153542 [Penicilliopsis zonata CBS 506.65]